MSGPHHQPNSRPPPLRSSTTSSLSPPLTCFTNCLLSLHGELLPQDLYFSPTTGLITPNYYFRAENVTRLDLGGRIVAPGFIEVQTNGYGGVHFSNLGTEDRDRKRDEDDLAKVAEGFLSHGVTGFYATVPTVSPQRWKQILPLLQPRAFPGGADLLGAHVEGPYLHPSKKGAHNASFFLNPSDANARVEDVYGSVNLKASGAVKMITLAPELPGAVALIGHLQERYPHIVISLGHSAATYEDGVRAVEMGARALTHTFNAMSAFHHRNPGLAGLMAGEGVWYSVIPDGVHVHPALLSMALRTNPGKCVVVTDSIELAGLEDGVYEGHGQIEGRQRKEKGKVTLEGTETLVGSCIGLDEGVRNLVRWSGCGVAEAMRCVTENVVGMMSRGAGVGEEWLVEEGYRERLEWEGEKVVADIRKRGMLEPGRRADFVILSTEAVVEETWMSGERVWKKGEEI